MKKTLNYKEIYKIFENSNIISQSKNYLLKTSENNDNYYLQYFNVIGENEADIVNYIATSNSTSIKTSVFIDFVDIESLTPVLVSNIFLAANNNITVLILVPNESDSTYQLLQTFGTEFFRNNSLNNKIGIYKQNPNNDNLSLQSPYSVISTAFLPSLYIDENNFKEYFYQTNYVKNITEEIGTLVKDYEKNELTINQMYDLFFLLLIDDIQLNVSDIEISDKTLNVINQDIYLNFLLRKYNFFSRIQGKPLVYIMLLRIIVVNSFIWKSGNENDQFVVGVNKKTIKKGIKDYKNEQNELIKKLSGEQKIKVENYVKNLLGLIKFVDSIFPGIYELAKNVKEHSSNKRGALSIRIFKKETLKSIKNKQAEIWSDYISNDELVKTNKFLDISIVDDGALGIFETLYNTLIEERTDELIELKKNSTDEHQKVNKGYLTFEEDIRIINDIIKNPEIEPSFQLHKRLFDLKTQKDSSPFTFQIKKASAGYGLMIFTANILENKGCFYVSTTSKGDKKQYGFFKSFCNDFIPVDFEEGTNGTKYNFVLPIQSKKIEFNMIEESVEQNGMTDEDIFLSLKNAKYKNNQDYILIEDNTKVGKELILLEDRKIDIYNFNGIKDIDRSELLRFLAKVNLSDEKQSNIIIYNIELSKLEELLDLLRILYSYMHKEFWADPTGNSQSILFYYLDKNHENGQLLYTTYLLCGRSIRAMKVVNKHIAYYQNAEIPVEEELDLIIENVDDNDLEKEIETILRAPFFKNNHPVFFDMLIPASDYHTLFEYNVHELLTKEID